ncbi:hypothetical protein GCM10009069_07510 [Algimonas arctica]|uniref:Peptidase M1 membrane alanine aminopeptidase domain-containing protein n=1 Tax=Algimonas arctica TaxID=1479486 RepID=A0A8J3CPQ7_9PROT|nr:hypothetical protein [Algimonas arctica]GHA86777.1 hypothetical protein GCM10009069_07510 [Algimonas arctica]
MPNWQTLLATGLASLCLNAPAFGADAPLYDDAPLHYIGSVEFKPDAGAMGAGWTVIVKEPDLDTIDFALNSAFGTAIVSGPGVQALTTRLDPQFDGAVRLYSIDLTPSMNGSDRVVKFAYGGPLFPEELTLPINTLNANKIELTVDSFWFPFDARFETDLTADLNIRIDGDWSAVGVGAVYRTPRGYRFAQDAPALDIAFSLLSNSVKVMADGYVIHDARTEPGAKMTELSAALEGCTTYLNALSGPAGPLPQASVIVTDRPEGGYSRGTLIALTDIENEDEEGLHQFICHELAHYWSKANAGGPENWINEGIADYLANMAIRDAMGTDVFDARMARYSEQLSGEALPPIWSPDLTERPPYLIMYRAAPMVLQALEQRMGEVAFATFMQRVMIDRVRTTPDLLALVEALSSAETRDWFEAQLAE